jgi:hypothetical protein
MKKIDILNYITNYRKAPNDIKTYKELLGHIGEPNEQKLQELLAELQQSKVLKQTELNGEKAFQVVTR